MWNKLEIIWRQKRLKSLKNVTYSFKYKHNKNVDELNWLGIFLAKILKKLFREKKKVKYFWKCQVVLTHNVWDKG